MGYKFTGAEDFGIGTPVEFEAQQRENKTK